MTADLDQNLAKVMVILSIKILFYKIIYLELIIIAEVKDISKTEILF